MKVIQIGAEAILIKEKNKLIKNRIPKSYRIKEIDEKIRKSRTKREAKILSKLDFVPKVFSIDDKKAIIEMEFIQGDLLRDILDSMNQRELEEICNKIGKQIYEMHQKGIIHGDLTTSNMILKDKKIFFIDFGLGFFSQRIEDKATDLRLLRQALESKHYKCFDIAYPNILNSYQDREVLEWLKNKVEKRGRYKRKKNEL
ncbi:MAG: KEOPS complex kinase/ATPase Bud32 [Nanoarchaeota archaeon]